MSRDSSFNSPDLFSKDGAKSASNQLKARERKLRNRLRLQKTNAQKAAKLGITVEELVANQYAEGQKILVDREAAKQNALRRMQ